MEKCQKNIMFFYSVFIIDLWSKIYIYNKETNKKTAGNCFFIDN